MTEQYQRRPRSRRRRHRRRQILKALAAVALSVPFAGYFGYRYWQKEQRRIKPGASDDIAYSGYYLGCAVSGSTPSNWRYETQYAQRFRCERTGSVNKIRWWNKFDERPGYHTGDGGTIQLEIRPDDGHGKPGELVLARSKPIKGAVAAGKFPLIDLEPEAPLRKGLLYHIVYNQLTPERGTISVNECLTYVPDTPLAPYFDDALASLRPIEGSWQVRPGHYPVFEIHYTDGIIKGQGYLMGYRDDRKLIAGSHAVRQSFIIPDGDRQALAVYFRLYRTSNSGKNLSVRLENGDGVPVEVLSVLETEVTLDPDHDSKDSQGQARAIRWIRKGFAIPYALKHRAQYRISLSAPEGASFYIQPVQDGRASGWGFAEDKLTLGSTRAEYTQDAGLEWRGATFFGIDNRKDLDYPILFEFS